MNKNVFRSKVIQLEIFSETFWTSSRSKFTDGKYFVAGIFMQLVVFV